MCDSTHSPASSTAEPLAKAGVTEEVLRMAGRFSEVVGAPIDNAKSGEPEEPHITCILMLLACQYDTNDILTTLAMALANIRRQEEEFKQMGERERAFVAAVHIYLAHIFIFDECVPLRYWHDWAFASYCSFGCLNRALGKLLKLMQYRPTVQGDIIEHNLLWLRGGAGAPDAPKASPLVGKW